MLDPVIKSIGENDPDFSQCKSCQDESAIICHDENGPYCISCKDTCDRYKIENSLDELSYEMDSLLKPLDNEDDWVEFEETDNKAEGSVSIEGKTCKKCGSESTRVNFGVVLCDNCKI